MHLPKPATVSEKYLAAIHQELVNMNQSGEKTEQEKIKELHTTDGDPIDVRTQSDNVETPTELSGVERHKCDLCGKTFKTAASLKTHKTRVHNGRNV